MPTDDPWIRGAHWVHVAQRKGRRLVRGWDIVPQLAELHRSDTPARWELEARILAREPLAQIASRCGMTDSQVRAYVSLFFDVRGRLDHLAYIQGVVLAGGSTWLPTDVGRVWRWEAYSGGSDHLDCVLRHYRRMGQPDYSYLLTDEPAGLTGDRLTRDSWTIRFETELRLRFAQLDEQTCRDARQHRLAQRQLAHLAGAQRPSRTELIGRQLDRLLPPSPPGPTG